VLDDAGAPTHGVPPSSTVESMLVLIIGVALISIPVAQKQIDVKRVMIIFISTFLISGHLRPIIKNKAIFLPKSTKESVSLKISNYQNEINCFLTPY
jgi:hypothetical protein